ncbi:hypothetical protein RhiirC2_788765 [Rhizophagus irregularis]|uniref:Uncharacterized protein n=1 Tax=Rhizophagus irregularis TaxID=588596 RepID=A0A2N1MPH0_9GLOM|nr:hypothetical protein RhiirC2_788765 [Rhizophagus irregularis]
MPCKIKCQQQVNKIPRKKERYVFQVITKETTIRETETAKESEKWLENSIIEEKGEVFGDLTECEAVENWTEENLKEFEEVGNRFITKALYWHDGAANSIRAVYDTGKSRTTITEIINSESYSLRSFSSPLLFPPPLPSSSSASLPEITSNSPFSIDNLHVRLKEINQQYEQDKMDASNNIVQTIWNKGTYIATCI